MIFYWVMSKVTAAAKKVVKLPAVPSRTYSDISVRSDSRMQETWFNLLHAIKLVTNPSSENSGSKVSGSSDKTFEIGGQFKNDKNNVLLFLAYNATLLKDFEKNKLGEHSSATRSGAWLNYFYDWFSNQIWSAAQFKLEKIQTSITFLILNIF